jgi:hypothetical protein
MTLEFVIYWTCDILIFTNCTNDPSNDKNAYNLNEYVMIKCSGASF